MAKKEQILIECKRNKSGTDKVINRLKLSLQMQCKKIIGPKQVLHKLFSGLRQSRVIIIKQSATAEYYLQ